MNTRQIPSLLIGLCFGLSTFAQSEIKCSRVSEASFEEAVELRTTSQLCHEEFGISLYDESGRILDVFAPLTCYTQREWDEVCLLQNSSGITLMLHPNEELCTTSTNVSLVDPRGSNDPSVIRFGSKRLGSFVLESPLECKTSFRRSHN